VPLNRLASSVTRHNILQIEKSLNWFSWNFILASFTNVYGYNRFWFKYAKACRFRMKIGEKDEAHFSLNASCVSLAMFEICTVNWQELALCTPGFNDARNEDFA
jgi:hypothetical protein